MLWASGFASESLPAVGRSISEETQKTIISKKNTEVPMHEGCTQDPVSAAAEGEEVRAGHRMPLTVHGTLGTYTPTRQFAARGYLSQFEGKVVRRIWHKEVVQSLRAEA